MSESFKNTYLPDMDRTIFDIAAEYPPFSDEEEHDCAIRMKHGETEEIRKKAQDEMVLHNIRLVISVARTFVGQGNAMAFADLVQEGMEGLLASCRHYDYTLGYKFNTYAMWHIRKQIRRSVIFKNQMIRIPENLTAQFNRIKKYEDNYRKKTGLDPTEDMIIKESHVGKQFVKAYFKYKITVLSLDAKPTGTDEGNILDIIEDENTKTPEEIYIEKNTEETIEKALARLPERQAEIIKMRFGICGYEQMTLQEVGDKLGITRERVNQIQRTAMERLRHGKCRQLLSGL